MPVFGSHFGAYKPEEAPRIPIDPDLQLPPRSISGSRAKILQRFVQRRRVILFGMIDRRADYGKTFEKDAAVPQVIVLGGKYILAPTVGLMVVNIRRARSGSLRSGFGGVDEERARDTDEYVPRQGAGQGRDRTIFDDHMSLLTSLGFDISPFGNDTIGERRPEGYSGEAGKSRRWWRICC